MNKSSREGEKTWHVLRLKAQLAIEHLVYARFATTLSGESISPLFNGCTTKFWGFLYVCMWSMESGCKQPQSRSLEWRRCAVNWGGWKYCCWLRIITPSIESLWLGSRNDPAAHSCIQKDRRSTTRWLNWAVESKMLNCLSVRFGVVWFVQFYPEGHKYNTQAIGWLRVEND